MCCSALMKMSLELIEDFHTNRHMTALLSIMAPELNLLRILLHITALIGNGRLFIDGI
jgi:hypothetical protein